MLCYTLNYHSGRSHLERVLGLLRSCQKGKKNPKNEEEAKKENIVWRNINIFKCFISSCPSHSPRLVSPAVKFDWKKKKGDRYGRDLKWLPHENQLNRLRLFRAGEKWLETRLWQISATSWSAQKKVIRQWLFTSSPDTRFIAHQIKLSGGKFKAMGSVFKHD